MPRKNQVTTERLTGLVTQIEGLGFTLGEVLDDASGAGTFARDVKPTTSDLLIITAVVRDLSALVGKLVMQQEMFKQYEELDRLQAQAQQKQQGG